MYSLWLSYIHVQCNDNKNQGFSGIMKQTTQKQIFQMHNMVKNPNWLAGGRSAGYLQAWPKFEPAGFYCMCVVLNAITVSPCCYCIIAFIKNWIIQGI